MQNHNKMSTNFLNTIYTWTDTDVTLCGIGFHSLVLKAKSETYRAGLEFKGKSENKIDEKYSGESLSETLESLMNSIDDQEVIYAEYLSIVKKIVYGTFEDQTVGDSFALGIYMILDYLQIQFSHSLFKSCNSVKFLTYLYQYCEDSMFVEQIQESTTKFVGKHIIPLPQYKIQYIENARVDILMELHKNPQNDYEAGVIAQQLSIRFEHTSRKYYAKDWKNNGGLSSLLKLLQKYDPIAVAQFGEKYEEYKDSKDPNIGTIINLYATSLHKQEKHAEAREIFKHDWEQNKHQLSLKNYITMLQNGLGGPKDTELASVLGKELIE